jgi:hypothetical protein
MEVKSTTWPKSYKDSKKSGRERNDCVVRAITETFGVPYDDAHAIAADKFKRKPQRGTMSVYPIFLDLNKAGYKIGEYEIDYIPHWDLTYKGSKSRIGLYDNKDDKNYKITVGMFLKQRPIGRYLVIVSGHAFSIVNGVIIGNKRDAERLKVRIENVIIAQKP